MALNVDDDNMMTQIWHQILKRIDKGQRKIKDGDDDNALTQIWRQVLKKRTNDKGQCKIKDGPKC